ncbi:hypothetical protein TNCV_2026291 [Trichonephila clavipes]|nr:hypothetical protein TNCV_2026291 [Trichonephila clavipes]
MTSKDILKCVQSSKSIIDTDSDGDKASPVLKSSEMRNIMKKRGGTLGLCTRAADTLGSALVSSVVVGYGFSEHMLRLKIETTIR